MISGTNKLSLDAYTKVSAKFYIWTRLYNEEKSRTITMFCLYNILS